MTDEPEIDGEEERESEIIPAKSPLDLFCRARSRAQRARIAIGNQIAACERGGWDPAMLEGAKESLALQGTAEESWDRLIKAEVRGHPVWRGWLRSVRGIAESLAGPLLEYLDPQKPHVSSWYKFVGLHCDDAGQAAKRVQGEKAAWNHYLKSHLMFKVGSAFLKSGGEYRDHYDHFKAGIAGRAPEQRAIDLCRGWVLAEAIGKFPVGTRLTVKDGKWAKVKKAAEPTGRTALVVHRSPGHIHRMATRLTVKLFLSHLYEQWRKILGLPVDQPYAQARLGHGGYIPPAQPPTTSDQRPQASQTTKGTTTEKRAISIKRPHRGSEPTSISDQ